MPTVQEPQVIIRIGTHAEKEYLLKMMPFLDGVIIGANLIEATPGATASLLVKLSGKKSNKPYYIDPMTYAFGPYIDRDSGRRRLDLDWIKSEQKIKKKPVRAIKRSYKKLAEQFGGPFEQAISAGKAITAEIFSDNAVLNKTCESVVNYQLRRIAAEFQNDPEFADYADLVPEPASVFAPYFYIDPARGTDGLDLMFKLTQATVGFVGSQASAVVCADESLLGDAAFVNRLKRDLPKTKVQGVWLWFSRFYEEDCDSKKLIAYKTLIEELSDYMRVYSLHGGYFSLALSRRGLTGISHGVGYGEQKDVMPVIGQSTPTVRYYLPGLHRRLGVPDIQRCFDALGVRTTADFYKKICDCVVCKGVVSKDISQFRAFGDMHRSTPQSKRLAQTPAAAKRCRFHFLMNRIKERDWLKRASLTEVIQKLDSSKATLGKLTPIRSSVKHLDNWREALS